MYDQIDVERAPALRRNGRLKRVVQRSAAVDSRSGYHACAPEDPERVPVHREHVALEAVE
jgi:hypothetical protein